MKSNDQLAHAGEEDHVRLVRDVPRAVDFTEPQVLGLGTVRHDLEDGASPVEADHATGVLKGRHGIAHFARGMLDALRLIRRGIPAGAALDMGITNKAFDSYEQGLIRDVIAARIPAKLDAAKLFG